MVIVPLNMLHFDYASVPVVDSGGEPITLADFIRSTRNEKRLSLSDVERQSGGQISDSYVWRIENGRNKNATPKMLRALARGLQVSEDVLFAVARGQSLREPSAVEAQLLALFRQLAEAWQDEVMRFVRSLHKAHAIPAEEVVSDKKKPTKVRHMRRAS